MLSNMRRRFIASAMAAFSLVVLALLLASNLLNYHMTTRQQDATLEVIREMESWGLPFFPADGVHLYNHNPFDGFSPEVRYMTRFFTVYCNAAGDITGVGHDYIASISPEQAAGYAAEILRQGKTKGYYSDYRYLKAADGDGSMIIFLNSEREIRSARMLLLITCAVSAISLVAVFLLVVLLSGRAMRPYEQNIAMQKRFITDAGHELKTPLTAIATSADVLALEQEENEWVQNIQKQADRLSKLVNNLVALSRLDEAQPLPKKTDFSLSEAVWEVSEPMTALCRAKGFSFTQSIEDDITLHGDKQAVQQIVSLLLDNALKYTNPGGKISLNVLKWNKKAEISLFNTCDYIAPEDVKRLFERFYRPDTSRSQQTGGSGIGLSIAKAAAEAQGGKIRVESQDGLSIKFTVTLPR